MDSASKHRTQLPDQLNKVTARLNTSVNNLGAIEEVPVVHANHDKTKGRPAHIRLQKSAYPRKPRSSTVSKEEIEPRSGLRRLRTVEANKAHLRATEYSMIKYASPWDSYDEKYELQFDIFITVAVKKDSPSALSTIKKFDQSSSDEKLLILQTLRHKCFSIPLDVFRFEESLYIVFEYISVSLFEVVRCPAYPNEEQLGAIFEQVCLNSEVWGR